MKILLIEVNSSSIFTSTVSLFLYFTLFFFSIENTDHVETLKAFCSKNAHSRFNWTITITFFLVELQVSPSTRHLIYIERIIFSPLSTLKSHKYW